MTTFRKTRAGAPQGFFEVEAAGLRWLAVPDGVRVAGVLEVGPDRIVLERIRTCAPTRAAAEEFGARLAVTHDAGAGAFGVGPDGWQGDGFIGNAPMALRPDARWGHFYAQQRVLDFAHEARRRGNLSADGLKVMERLADRLRHGDFDDGTPPARIHGDLWGGNVLFGPDGVVLIDPAAHGGHRVTDLAMLALFGTPHLATVYAAYEEASDGLPHSWRDLIDLHQVHPLLVHAVLFGGGYGPQAVAAACRYLG